ncbi:DUF6074 family protein [Devosia crocina]|uniref:DUF6074 family protein n=1 Tax=Devosia crocina TaxID=429728 RepID=UPI000B85B04B|nr:DUF6074 family protein [Devosia crocina]
MAEQLDLLSWQPSPAVVLAFPQDRNRTRIRHVVDLLEKRQTQDRLQRCFDRELRSLAKSLKAMGLDEHQIDRQLDRFTQAVNFELWRRDFRHRPGGAA